MLIVTLIGEIFPSRINSHIFFNFQYNFALVLKFFSKGGEA